MGSGVARLRISNNGSTVGGVLRTGLEMPVPVDGHWLVAHQHRVGWSGTPGRRRVYAQVRDRAGNWSSVSSDTILFQ